MSNQKVILFNGHSPIEWNKWCSAISLIERSSNYSKHVRCDLFWNNFYFYYSIFVSINCNCTSSNSWFKSTTNSSICGAHFAISPSGTQSTVTITQVIGAKDLFRSWTMIITPQHRKVWTYHPMGPVVIGQKLDKKEGPWKGIRLTPSS
jgi:hypothetical protein